MKTRADNNAVKKRGPKANPGKARAAILDAARSEFGKRGFDGATLRSIAREAEVDVALVSYYFGSKSELFVASLNLPVNPAVVLPSVLAEGLDGAAARLLGVLLDVWDDPATGAPLIAMMRSVSTQASLLREFIESQLVAAIAEAIEGPDAELRAGAFTSQVFGLVLERYVLGVEPLASARHEEIVRLIGPTLQRYLDGED
jgi:AcrR family transcriptional regulator